MPLGKSVTEIAVAAGGGGGQWWSVRRSIGVQNTAATGRESHDPQVVSSSHSIVHLATTAIMGQDEGDSKPLSSHEIEQAMAQVQNISAMLDSRTNPANVQAPASSQFPGLVEILPHLLAPLAEIQRTAASAMQQNQQRQRQSQQQQQQGQQQQQQPAQQQQDQSQQPSSMLTYRPLVSQVQAVIAQLTSTSNDQSPGGGAQSVRLADDARQRRKSKTLTKEQKREAILDARRRRRERQQGQQQQGQQQSQHQEQQPEQQVEQETEQKTQEAVGQGSGAANADSAMADDTIAAESVQTTAAPQASTTPSLAS